MEGDKMSLIGIDFETKSDVDLKKHGMKKYLAGKEADIICMGYKIDDRPTELWVPGDPIPLFTKLEYSYQHKFYAFNAQFDMAVWNTLGKKYNFQYIDSSWWIDVMALCGRFTYHQSLANAGEDLELKVKKNPRGKALIKLISTPPFIYTHTDLMEFHAYCKDDVNSMYEMLNALPASKLSDSEQKIWELTVKINNHGIPVDIDAAKVIYKLTEIYKEDMNELLPGLTGNVITKATQSIRITKWLRTQGVIAPNLQAATVEKLLKSLVLTDNVRTVLQLRQELGRSSTAKYLKLIEMCHDKRIYSNLRYYAASTGRWGGLGFQLHNLPRSKVKDAQPIIDQFMNYEIIENDPITAAKSIIRGMICAPKGKRICAVDYKGIENRGLAWVAQDEDTLELFRKGLNQYKDMASYLFKIPYEDVNDDQYYTSKQLVLGCGYGLGWKGFMGYMEGYGTPITEEVAQFGVNGWRTKYHKVVKLWYACKNAAINAISNPGLTFKVSNCKFKLTYDRNRTKWLQLTIPSGRNLYYNKPEIGEGIYGAEVDAMGINPYSKKWQRLKIIPGRFVENIIQALSRDVLAQGKLNLDDAGYQIIGSIHDEVLLEVDKEHDCLTEVDRLMCDMPTWAYGLPLETEGMIEKRYRKM
jgi:DNA polymerase